MWEFHQTEEKNKREETSGDETKRNERGSVDFTCSACVKNPCWRNDVVDRLKRGAKSYIFRGRTDLLIASAIKWDSKVKRCCLLACTCSLALACLKEKALLCLCVSGRVVVCMWVCVRERVSVCVQKRGSAVVRSCTLAIWMCTKLFGLCICGDVNRKKRRVFITWGWDNEFLPRGPSSLRQTHTQTRTHAHMRTRTQTLI